MKFRTAAPEVAGRAHSGTLWGSPFSGRSRTLQNLKLVLEYDGTRFHGWQAQPGQLTVQGELEKAVRAIVRHDVTLQASSRTDAGVHAEGQVVNFATSKRLPEIKMRKALNAVLPADIAVRNVERVPETFHARFGACWKTYRYRLWNRARRPATGLERRLHVPRPLAVEPMRAATRYLLGENDFAAFAHKEAHQKVTRRRIYKFEIARTRGCIDIEVSGDGFLYNMVRILVGTLVEVGKGQRSVASVLTALRSRRRQLAGPTAPARGLTLREVFYTPWGAA